MRTARLLLAALVLALSATACGSDVTGPAPEGGSCPIIGSGTC